MDQLQVYDGCGRPEIFNPIDGCTPIGHIRFDTAMFFLAADGTEGRLRLHSRWEPGTRCEFCLLSTHN